MLIGPPIEALDQIVRAIPRRSILIWSNRKGEKLPRGEANERLVGSSSFHRYSMSCRRRASYPCNFSFTANIQPPVNAREEEKPERPRRRFFECEQPDTRNIPRWCKVSHESPFFLSPVSSTDPYPRRSRIPRDVFSYFSPVTPEITDPQFAYSRHSYGSVTELSEALHFCKNFQRSEELLDTRAKGEHVISTRSKFIWKLPLHDLVCLFLAVRSNETVRLLSDIRCDSMIKVDTIPKGKCKMEVKLTPFRNILPLRLINGTSKELFPWYLSINDKQITLLYYFWLQMQFAA